MVYFQGLLFAHQLASFAWKLECYCWIYLKIRCSILKHLYNFVGLAPLAAFGYVMATHLSLYPAILIVPVRATTTISIYSFFSVQLFLWYLPLNCIVGFLTPWQVILLLGYGPDAPPTKVFLVKSSSDSKSDMSEYDKRTSLKVQRFSWMTVLHFIFWLFIWSCYVLLLSSMILKKVGGLSEMFEKYDAFFFFVIWVSSVVI